MPVNQLPDAVRKQRAIELLNQGQMEKARILLSEMCGADQTDIETWSLYIAANGYLERYEDVIFASLKALEIEAEYLPALNSLASALAAQGRHDEAAEHFKTLLRLAPDNPSVLSNYGHTLFLIGKVDAARKVFEEAVRLQPHYAEAHYNLAILMEQSGHTENALREYELAAALKPGLPGLDIRMQQLRENLG